jgi:hypothetical protein
MTEQDLLSDVLEGDASFVTTPGRASILMALAKLVGLEPSSTAYQNAVYPFDSPTVASELAASQSGCGLVTEVGERAFPVDEDALYLPVSKRSQLGGRDYPIALERDDAGKWGGWIDCTIWDKGKRDPLFLPADPVIIGCSSCPGVWSKGGVVVEHELTTLFFDPITMTLWSIDGGQPGVKVRTRKVIEVSAHRELWLGNLDANGNCALDPADGRPTVGRRVLGIINADMYPVRIAS